MQDKSYKIQDTGCRMKKCDILMIHCIFLNPESWILYPKPTGKPTKQQKMR